MALLPLKEGPLIELVAEGTYGIGTRVKLNAAGKAEVAGAADRAIGYICGTGAVAETLCCVRVVSMPAMRYAIAHAAVEVGDVLYSQAAGRVDDADAGEVHVIGVALDAATAQDDVIRILPVDSGVATAAAG